MGAHFHTVEWDNAIWFSTLFRMSGFRWHSSKWVCQFDRFLQYKPGLELLACSLDTDLNYVTLAMPQLCPFLRKIRRLVIDRYVTKQQSLLGPRPSAEFCGKMHKILISQADFVSTLAFLCCHYIFD